MRKRKQLQQWAHVRTFFVLAAVVGTSGCSGLLSESLTVSGLENQAILPPETQSLESLVNPTSVDDAFSEPTLVMDGLSAELSDDRSDELLAELPDELSDANNMQDKAEDLESSGFRFQANLPDEPSFTDNPTSNSTSQPSLSSEQQTSESTPAIVTLVAQPSQPAADASKPTGDLKPTSNAQPTDHVKAATSNVNDQTSFAPLKPITIQAPNVSDSNFAVASTSAAPQRLSRADLEQVTQAVVTTAPMQAGELIDLSAFELELPSQPIAATVPPPAVQKELTASEHLAETIRMLKSEGLSGNDAAAQEAPASKVSVRLLEILQRKIEDASEFESTLTEEELNFWQQQLLAIELMFQTPPESRDATHHDRHQAALQAIQHLEDAGSHLRSLVGLQLRGGQLCSQIGGFGKIRTLDSHDFQPGDRALVYLEVENQFSAQIDDELAVSTNAPKQWQTRLQASYAIYDSNGQVAQEHAYPVIEDVARQRRRDFYLHLPLTIEELPAGDYRLEIVVEDLGKTAVATLPAVSLTVR